MYLDVPPLVLRCENSDFVFSEASEFEYTQRSVLLLANLLSIKFLIISIALFAMEVPSPSLLMPGLPP